LIGHGVVDAEHAPIECGLYLPQPAFQCRRLARIPRARKFNALSDFTKDERTQKEILQADETFIGGKEKNKHLGKRNSGNIGGTGKEAVLSLVERGSKVRSQHVAAVNAQILKPLLEAQLDRKSTLMTDGEGQYRIIGPLFARHETVNHSIEEYVRGDAYTNTVEGYFAIFKRGVYGVFHHISEQHLKRYLCEFDFRYNERSALGVEDVERRTKAIKGIVGKRLTYKQPLGGQG